MIVFVCLMEALISELLLRSGIISLWLNRKIDTIFVWTFVAGTWVVFLVTDMLVFYNLSWSNLSLIVLSPKGLTLEIITLLFLFVHLVLEFRVAWKIIFFILTHFFNVLVLWKWLMSNLFTLIIRIATLNALGYVSLLVIILMMQVLSWSNIVFWLLHVLLTF